jgi:hypothetical protein
LPQWEPTWSAGGTLHLRDLEAFAALTWYGRLFDLMNIRYLPQGLDPPPPTEGKYEPWDVGPAARWQVDLTGLAPLDGVVEIRVQGGEIEVVVERGVADAWRDA